MSPRVLAFIFARGGSKGVPRKNIRLLAGKPLLAYSIEAARACPGVERVIVSTDDMEIAQVARDFGAEVPFIRPAELASDTASEWLAWQHAVREIWPTEAGRETDVFLSVPTTSPLRTSDDLTLCVQTLLREKADFVTTVSPSRKNPYFNMVTIAPDGAVQLAVAGTQLYAGRQQAPVVYDITTVGYATYPAYILRANEMFDGKLRAAIIPPERGLDIDTELDFEFAEFWMEKHGAR